MTTTMYLKADLFDTVTMWLAVAECEVRSEHWQRLCADLRLALALCGDGFEEREVEVRDEGVATMVAAAMWYATGGAEGTRDALVERVVREARGVEEVVAGAMRRRAARIVRQMRAGELGVERRAEARHVARRLRRTRELPASVWAEAARLIGFDEAWSFGVED